MYVEKLRELSGKSLRDNQQPSLLRNQFEGSTTKVNDPERIMKPVQPSGDESLKWKCVAS